MKIYHLIIICLFFGACGKSGTTTTMPVTPVISTVNITNITLNNVSFDNMLYGIAIVPSISIQFSQPINRNSTRAIMLKDANGTMISTITNFQNHDSTLLIQPSSALQYLSKYFFSITSNLQSASGGGLTTPIDKVFLTQIDSSNKFPIVDDSILLDKIQQQTLKYFVDFSHPVSGLARERNTSGDIVTTGGSGFGIMAIVAGINRHFITRSQGFMQLQKIVGFLKNTAQKVHGAFPHWLNGSTGLIVPFSVKDDGADLVETSYLLQGLLTARQYFTNSSADETNFRADINLLWNGVEWDWFRQNNQNVLYWHYSNNYSWDMNVKIQGWNECLITYVLAASSTTHAIPAAVYNSGWARGSGFINGSSYYGYPLPLGQVQGGPLFFSHYSFLGINPNGLMDAYANYTTQTKNHTLINYSYCVANPQNNYGYSNACWGLTASDIQNGYTASSPTNDIGVIAPTAAISSLPYTPTESMRALKFFYYTLGDKLWGDYGFYDAFSLKSTWFANSTLAIDQGPIIVMIENYRTGLLWNLFTSCPEVKTGMLNLGFKAPYL
ncbi:glucoamylase family protein [Parasediminibacterium paludis]|uniref:Glucoamylase family protein n=1 Tax=Parasediminibacterium paludis TaxID=908966 RepID=A0ABV8PYB7_9BACT